MLTPEQIRRPLVSIVDDDRSVRQSLKMLFESAEFDTEVFASAEEYLAAGNLGESDCLVLDVHIGGTSGFELQERLAVPVIFITAHDDASTRARIEQSTAIAHLKKPFDTVTVLDAIHRATRGDPLDQGPLGSPRDVRHT